MTDLPDQNQPSPAPPWVAPPAAPAPTNASSTIKPTIEPIIENPPDNASPPPEPTVEPMIYQPDDKGKKILTAGSIIASIILLASISYFSLSWLYKKKAGEITQPTRQAPSESIPSATKNIQLGPGEKKEVVEWKQPSQELQNIEIAESALAWLNEQRDSRGVYIGGYRCLMEGECYDQQTDTRAGFSAIWGRFKHYQETKDENDLSIINKDISLYSNESIVPIIQNDFWNCKLMYELLQSDDISENDGNYISSYYLVKKS